MLRIVQHGETYLITEHRRPVTEVCCGDSDVKPKYYPPEPFSLTGIDNEDPIEGKPGLAMELISEDRDE